MAQKTRAASLDSNFIHGADGTAYGPWWSQVWLAGNASPLISHARGPLRRLAVKSASRVSRFGRICVSFIMNKTEFNYFQNIQALLSRYCYIRPKGYFHNNLRLRYSCFLFKIYLRLSQ